jgi:tetratricopeptide (TPR) repeat protein
MRHTSKMDGGRLQDLLSGAEAELIQGRPDTAARASRKILKLAPGHPGALRVLGMAQLSSGDATGAATSLRRAAAGDPANAEIHYAHGLALRAAGATEGAAVAYRAALALQPDHTLALNNLAGLLIEQGAFAEAAELADRAVRAAPQFGAAHNTLGNARAGAGDFDAAIDSYRQALTLNPALVQAHYNWGKALVKQDKLYEAIGRFRRAASANPPYLLALPRLGATLRATGRHAEAIKVLREAAERLPQDGGVWLELGNALSDTLDFEGSERAYRKALSLRPDDPQALNGLGYTFSWRKQFAEALRCYDAAIAAGPEFPGLRFSKAVMALLHDDLRTGFPLYEDRPGVVALYKEAAESAPVLTPTGVANRTGASGGPTVLIRDEQGFGDTALFARYVPPLAARGFRVVLQVREPMVRLLRGLAGVASVVGRDEPTPEHDCKSVLPSLPWCLEATTHALPATGRYLAPPEELVAPWAERLAGPRPVVAVAWAGNASPPHRSIPLATFAQVFACAGVRFVSMQKDLDEADRATLGQLGVIDVAAELHDFADTAALLEAVDLVITIDTAVANLAGALARPVWVALGYLPDWRWGAEGDGTPWFPTARLFRQDAPGAWGPVVDGIKAALTAWAADPIAAPKKGAARIPDGAPERKS